MAETPDQRASRSAKGTGRDDRLKAALKANLAKRKAQARGRGQGKGATAPDTEETGAKDRSDET